MFPLTKFMFL